MDFSFRELDAETRAFWQEVSDFFDEHLTEEVFEHEHRTGDGHNFELTRKLGAKGWLHPSWPVEEGGIAATPIQQAIISLEVNRRFVPNITNGTTSLVVPAIRQWLAEPMKSEIIRGVGKGEIFMCLGYTEPDAGSDLANVSTKAVRDGDEWLINGQKIFSTGAHNCDYAFLVTRTNPDVAKHKGLTMFLVPLKQPGVEIHPIHTLGGERTNTVFYENVRVHDSYRLGPVDDGWNVLNGPLQAEHGRGSSEFVEQAGMGVGFSLDLKASWDAVVEWARQPRPDGSRPIEDPLVRQRLAAVALDIEVGALTPGPMGRVLASENLIKRAADLVDLVGPEALVDRHGEGAVGDGAVDYAHRFAQGTATYAGTVEIHRNIIAEHFLGLPRSRPSSSMTKR